MVYSSWMHCHKFRFLGIYRLGEVLGRGSFNFGFFGCVMVKMLQVK